MRERVFLYSGALCLGLTFIGFGINSWSARPAGGGAVRPAETNAMGGSAVSDIDLAGNKLYDSTAAAAIGTAAATGHSLTTGDVICGGKIEVDGNLYADGPAIFTTAYGTSTINGSIWTFAGSIFTLAITAPAQTGKAGYLGVGSSARYILLADYEDMGTSFGFANPTDPTFVVQAFDNTDKTQRSALDWHRLSLGGDGGGYGCSSQTFAYDDLTDGGGASGTLDLDEGIPDGAVVQQTVLHTLTGFTGDVSAAITVGDGVDVDRYNTGTPSVFTTNASGIAMGVPSGTTWHDAAATVTVTITTNADYTSVSAGQATILICYWTP